MKIYFYTVLGGQGNLHCSIISFGVIEIFVCFHVLLLISSIKTSTSFLNLGTGTRKAYFETEA